MKTILFNYHELVNGSLIDCIDLFVYMHILHKEVFLSIITSKNLYGLLKEIFQERGYDTSFLKDVLFIRKIDIFKYEKLVIFDYTTFLENLDFFKKSKVVYISNMLFFEKNNKFLLNRKKYENIEVWGETEYFFYAERPYIQKILLPNVQEKKKGTLIVCPSKNKDEVYRLIDSHNISLKENFILRTSSTHNHFWGNFDNLIYIQNSSVYDRKPRILYECKRLDIPISYYRDGNFLDGSFIRYYDTKEREYTEDDILVRFLDA